jgi:lipopolysaccharide exporter
VSTGIGQRMARGAGWMVLFRLIDRAIALASTLILARLLVPADFGIVAIASSVLALLEVFTMLGLDVALISKRDVTRVHYDTAWTIGIISGGGVMLALLALALPAASLFSEPRLAPVIAALSVGSLIQGFENIGVVDFRKELQFAKEFRFQIARRFIMFAVTVPLAFLLRSYWALVAGAIAGRLSWVVLSFFAHPFRPRFGLGASRDLLGFSGWLLLLGILRYFKDQTAYLVLGRLSGPSAVGLYSLSYELASMPTAQLIAPINRAVLPGLAKIAGDREELRERSLDLLALTAVLAIPVGVGLAAVAPLLVPLLLGEKWLDTIPVIQLLAVASAGGAWLSSSYSIFLALEVPRVTAMVDMGFVAVQLALMILLCDRYGPEGAAVAALITLALTVPVNYYLLLPRIGLQWRVFLSRLWRPPLAAATMWFAVSLYIGAGSSVARDVLHLAIAVSIGICSYCGVLGCLWLLSGRPAGAERLLTEAVGHKLWGMRTGKRDQ